MSFEIGDKVIDLRYGEGRVTNISDIDEDYPIIVRFTEHIPKLEHYTVNGKYHINDLYPILYHVEGFIPPTCNEPERISECSFKPFDKVLVRDNISEAWLPKFFREYNPEEVVKKNYPYVTIEGNAWHFCIPYEGNEDKAGKAY